MSLHFFSHVDGLSGAHILSIGFPNSHNFLNRFYSRCWNPICEGVDAFCYDWVGDNNWLVSPVSLVPRVIRNLGLFFRLCLRLRQSSFRLIISDGVKSGIRIKWTRSDSSDSDYIELLTPLTTPIFDFHSRKRSYDSESVATENQPK